jgi:hypothetical protein
MRWRFSCQLTDNLNTSSPGIREGLQSLINGGIPPKLLVIDDGWQVSLEFEVVTK